MKGSSDDKPDDGRRVLSHASQFAKVHHECFRGTKLMHISALVMLVNINPKRQQQHTVVLTSRSKYKAFMFPPSKKKNHSTSPAHHQHSSHIQISPLSLLLKSSTTYNSPLTTSKNENNPLPRHCPHPPPNSRLRRPTTPNLSLQNHKHEHQRAQRDPDRSGHPQHHRGCHPGTGGRDRWRCREGPRWERRGWRGGSSDDGDGEGDGGEEG